MLGWDAESRCGADSGSTCLFFPFDVSGWCVITAERSGVGENTQSGFANREMLCGAYVFVGVGVGVREKTLGSPSPSDSCGSLRAHGGRDSLDTMNSHKEVLSFSFLVQPFCDTRSSFFSSETTLPRCSAHLACLCSTYAVGLNVTACSIERWSI